MVPIASIVTPVFNKGELLQTMINSILAQDYQDWELLLVDDGSDEKTLTLLQHIQKSDKRIRFFKRNRLPKGAQTCRNIGFEQAKGCYILFFDSDDYIAPYCLSQRICFMEAHSELDFSIFPAATFQREYNDGTIRYGLPPKTKDDLLLFLLPHLPFVVWNNIYRSDSLRKYGIEWDERLKSLQDSDFNIQSIMLGLKYDYASSYEKVKPDYYYRVLADISSISKCITDISHFESHLYFYQKNIDEVRTYCGKSYEYVLKNRSIFFFRKIIVGGNDALPYLRRLEEIVQGFKGGNMLIIRFRFYAFLCRKYGIRNKLLDFCFFSVLFRYYFFYRK